MSSTDKKNPNEYIWICGTSGVGKETLIRKLAEENNLKLREVFKINNSFDVYGPGFDDYTAESLSKISIGQALIKWQFRTHESVKRVTELKPDSKHRAIILWRPPDIQIGDLQRRGNCPEGDSAETLRFDWDIVKNLFSKLRSETALKIQLINASKSSYQEMQDWP